jgi:hypothetical protein
MDNPPVTSPARALRGRGLPATLKSAFGGNAYNLKEFAGAFGDLGTLIPFVLGYIAVSRIDPVGILVSLGILKIFTGLYFKTPIPVQPMKAIGAAAIGNPGAFSPSAVWGSGLFSAVIWVVLALTGAVDWLKKITAPPVMRGIMVGLGLSFVLEGLRMMGDQWLLAAIAAAACLLLLSNRRVPAALVILCLGIGYSLVFLPEMRAQLTGTAVGFRLPTLVFDRIDWSQAAVGALLLGIPQVPLTLGNAVLGTAEENNQLFPNHPITVRKVALDHGLINAVSFALGGMPVCHGAGGLAGHVRFGARTGGALVILGGILLVLGLFFSDSVTILFNLVPAAVLGVILAFAGLELATLSWNTGGEKKDIFVLVTTAGLAVFNIGIAFVAGLALYYALRKKLVKV